MKNLLWMGVVVALMSGGLAACGNDPSPSSETPPPSEEPPQSSLQFDLEGDGFYRMPWPHDIRRNSRGTLDLSDFPNPRRNALLNRYISAIERDVTGFATMPVIYVPSSEALSSEGLPTPAESLAVNSLVQLVALNNGRCGDVVPILVRADGPSDQFEAKHRFTVEMVPGGSLVPSTAYALILREGLKHADGSLISRNISFAQALNGTGANAQLNATYAPLRDCVPEIVSDESVLVATVFTTHDPVDEMLRLRETVRNPDAVEMRDLALFERSSTYSNNSREVYFGEFETPIFLRGETPYTDEGGGLEFDELGAPIVQRWENVPFSLSYPKGAEGPLATIVWVDGTGAGLTSPIGDGWYNRALQEGFAIATLVAPFHGTRAVEGSDEVMSSFNYFNPEAGRTVFRQQASEVSYFLRVLEERVNPSLASHNVQADIGDLHYGGHSQGGIVGALATSVEPDFRSAVFNGTGGWLAVTIIERKDIMDIAGVVSLLFGMRSGIDKSHPIVQLAQLGAEVVDPQSYVRRWAGSPEDPNGLHVLVINGNEDGTTHVDAVNHLTLTANLPVIEPAGWSLDAYGVFDVRTTEMPLEPNTSTPSGDKVMHAAWLEESGGHFTIYYNSSVRDMAVEFWKSVRDGTFKVSASE